MPTKASVLKSFRLTHMYLGIFTTPAILFFAFTGAVQTFGLHETQRGSDYKPAAILVELAQLHKHQTIVVPPPRKQQPDPRLAVPGQMKLENGTQGQAPARPDGAQGKQEHPGTDKAKPAGDSVGAPGLAAPSPVSPSVSAAPPNAPAPAKHNTVPMKVFFLVVSLALLLSTITGLYMSYTFIRNKVAVSLTLVAGVAVPLLLLLF